MLKQISRQRPRWSASAAIPFRFDGFVNPPVVRGSTVLYPTYADLAAHRGRYSYGRRGNPHHRGA